MKHHTLLCGLNIEHFSVLRFKRCWFIWLTLLVFRFYLVRDLHTGITDFLDLITPFMFIFLHWDFSFLAVEKAASVFSLKLDTGHKLLCPWIDNICDESLALFPPTPPPVLVENYYECFSSLLCLSSLPRISPASLDIMRKWSPQLEQFLLEPFSSSVVLKGGFMLTEDSTIRDLDGTFQDASIYYQVRLWFTHNYSSLCGVYCFAIYLCHVHILFSSIFC